MEDNEPNIFLCYRREDTEGFARGIYDRLASRYGNDNVFRDIDSTPAGFKYIPLLESRLSQCDVMVVLIGNTWLSVGQNRLRSPKDLVRRENEAALKQDIPIIPVCIQGAPMPSEEDLPPEINGFASFQSAEVTDSRWAYDIEHLIQAINYLTSSRASSSRHKS